MPPEDEVSAEEQAALDAALADLKRGPDWAGDEEDEVFSVRVALAVAAHRQILRVLAEEDLLRLLPLVLLRASTEEDIHDILRRAFDHVHNLVEAGNTRLATTGELGFKILW